MRARSEMNKKIYVNESVEGIYGLSALLIF